MHTVSRHLRLYENVASVYDYFIMTLCALINPLLGFGNAELNR